MSFNKPIWWARDAANILRQNGSDEHADAVIAVCDKASALEAALAEANGWKAKWEACEKWRKAYQEAKGELFSMGGEIAEAAIQHMPCNESMVDRWFRAEYVHRTAFDAVAAELAEAREDKERLDWCSKHGAMAVEWWQGGYRVVTQHNVWMTEVHDIPRAAIDAARARKP